MRSQRLLSSTLRACCLGLALASASAAAALGVDLQYALGAGDKVRIGVYDKPDLSGEFAIGPGATLSLPMLGRIPVAGLTLSALEDVLVERLVRMANVTSPRITVEIVEYRPFFILGAVAASGQYPYVDGLTVLQAISIAGGFRRDDSQDIVAQLEAARARERYQLANEALAVAHARRARLIAERDQSGTISFPAIMNDYVGPAKLEELTINENRLLEQRTQSLTAENALLEAQKIILGEEILALEGQRAAKIQLAEFVKQEMAEIEKLRQRDLVPLTRVLALRRSAAELEGDRVQLMAYIARAKHEVAKVDLTILNLRKARNIQLAEGAKQVDDELTQLGINRRAAAELLYRAEAALSRTTVQPVFTELNGEVVIVRQGADGARQIKAADDTRILPGDLIKVPSRPAAPTESERRAQSAQLR